MINTRHRVVFMAVCLAWLWPGPGVLANDDERIEQDLQQLQGAWKVISAEEEGRSLQSVFEQATVVISDSQIAVHYGEDDRTDMAFRINSSRRPKEIDLTLSADDGVRDLVGIYAVHGDEVTLCYNSRPGGPRPATFATRDVPGIQTLLVLKRLESPNR